MNTYVPGPHWKEAGGRGEPSRGSWFSRARCKERKSKTELIYMYWRGILEEVGAEEHGQPPLLSFPPPSPNPKPSPGAPCRASSVAALQAEPIRHKLRATGPRRLGICCAGLQPGAHAAEAFPRAVQLRGAGETLLGSQSAWLQNPHPLNVGAAPS